MYSRVALRIAVCSLLTVAATTGIAHAQDKIYFPAVDNTITPIVNAINAEKVRVDISAWYLTEHAISQAIVAKFNSGVPVRVMGDRGSIFEIDKATRLEFYYLANAGVPIRLRYNPWWYPEIDHLKCAVFVGQGLVEFGSSNWATYELTPASSTNYSDETVMFTTDPVLFGAFETRFDIMWNDTTKEPAYSSVATSKISGPPYFMNWWDACTAEANLGLTGACSDFKTYYPNGPAKAMTVNTARLAPTNPYPADLIWGQGPDFNNRLVTEINNEKTRVRFVIYRLTVDNITNALISKFQSGVPVQVIVEPNEYLNRKWPEFEISHANEDKLWAAGIPMLKRAHQGLTHMKLLVTANYATNASSNYAAAWQRDNDYFVSSATKPTIYTAMLNRFDTMWNNTTDFVPFVPGPPDSPVLASPSSGATSVSTTPTLTWNRAVFAVSYDVYLGTSSSSMARVGNVPAQMVNDPPKTYSFTPATALQAGTTYYWKVVSRTNATPKNPSLIGPSPTSSFTTSGTTSGGGGTGGGSSVPSPWISSDVGIVGLAGSATYSSTSGLFTVKGAGSDIWGAADSFQYVYQPLSGDGTIIARVGSETNTNTYAKAGVMLRQTLDADSANVMVDVSPTGNVEFMSRASKGASTTWLAGATQAFPAWVKLTRSGTTITGYVSADGSTWRTIGSTSVSMATTIDAGLIVCSHTTTVLNTATFDRVSVTQSTTAPPPPPPSASNVVIYASDISSSALHGTWALTSDATSPNSIKIASPDNGFAQTSAPLASPANYVDVTFNANSGTPYTIWLRLQALNNDKYNDSIWVQFSDARVNGSSVYAMNTTSGLLVNLATDSTGSSLSGWGWQNGAYWVSQPTTVTFPTTGSHTMRIQIREDGVQFDQIVLSPTTYLSSSPGSVTNDRTIVPKQ